MQIVRFEANSKIKYGILNDKLVLGLSGDPFRDFQSGTF